MARKLDDGEVGNGLTPERFLEHFKAIRVARRGLDTAAGLHRLAKKAAKAGGVDLDALSLMETLAKLEPEDAESRIRNLRRYMAWDGQGVQLDMFGAVADDDAPEAPTGKAREAHAEFLARETGVAHGRAGGAVTDCTYAPGTGLQQAWMAGCREGLAARDATGAPATAKKAGGRRRLREPIKEGEPVH